MYPGDPHAHPANVYNCRCTLVASVKGFRKVDSSANSLTSAAEGSIINTKQFSKKVGKHAADFALDPSTESDRETMQNIISNITENATEIRSGSWRGQEGDVLFYILGEDVVLRKQNGESITILKGGINNAKVSITRYKWDGLHTNFYSFDGATYLNASDQVNTIYAKKDFKKDTSKILEEFE